jgi:hypothetical protein
VKTRAAADFGMSQAAQTTAYLGASGALAAILAFAQTTTG